MRTFKLSLSLFVTLALVLTLPGISLGSEVISKPDGKDIIKKMYREYNDTWYRFLTFRQQTIFYKNGKEDHRQTWYEALSLPGKLAIKFDSLKSGTGIIFRSDSQYVFQNNRLVQESPRVHDLLILGFDVYAEKPSVTAGRLKRQGFDLSKTYETKWRGRDVYVVGASGKEDRSPQFWIDKKRLYFVRLIRGNGKNGVIQETQFKNYKKTEGGWVATEVSFSVNDKTVLREIYSDIKTPLSLRDSIFDTIYFKGATW